MKKFYTSIALGALMTFSASAATRTLSADEARNAGFRSSDPANTEIQSNLTLKALAEESPCEISRKAPAKVAPEGDWTDLGKGIWFEGLMSLFSDVPDGERWEVTIEESATTPGYYRVAPYTADSFVGKLIGKADETAIYYIDATNPDKVIVDGDILAYGMIIFCQINPENGFQGDNYGTLKDGIISFGPQSFAYTQDGSSWYTANKNGSFRIALPGVTVKDYTLKAVGPLCTESKSITTGITVGADVTALKYVILSGHYPCSDDNNKVVASIGTDLEAKSGNVVLTKEEDSFVEDGINTLLIAALDGENVVGGTAFYFFIQNDDSENWKSIGKAKMNEGYLCSLFSDIDTEELEVDVEEHKSIDNYYRLVNPYANHSATNGTLCSHNHYLYINATNPEQVYINASAAGFGLDGFGELMVWSKAHRYLDAGNTAEEIANAGFFGKLDGREITMPDNSLLLSFSNLDNAQLYTAGEGFKVTLPEVKPSGIEGIEVGSDAKAEYFNLQGMPVSAPAAGQLYIIRQGDKTTKRIF